MSLMSMRSPAAVVVHVSQFLKIKTTFALGADDDHSILFFIKEEVTKKDAHAGSRTRVTSMGGLYDAATLHAP